MLECLRYETKPYKALALDLWGSWRNGEVGVLLSDPLQPRVVVGVRFPSRVQIETVCKQMIIE